MIDGIETDEHGTIKHYKNGEQHRLDGPAIEYTDGFKAWYQNGRLHRDDGPAVEFTNGDKWWYKNGKLHRIDGPAIEYFGGYKLWYIDGVKYSEEKFKAEIIKRGTPTTPTTR
jgi:hypothetical protein